MPCHAIRAQYKLQDILHISQIHQTHLLPQLVKLPNHGNLEPKAYKNENKFFQMVKRRDNELRMVHCQLTLHILYHFRMDSPRWPLSPRRHHLGMNAGSELQYCPSITLIYTTLKIRARLASNNQDLL